MRANLPTYYPWPKPSSWQEHSLAVREITKLLDHHTDLHCNVLATHDGEHYYLLLEITKGGVNLNPFGSNAIVKVFFHQDSKLHIRRPVELDIKNKNHELINEIKTILDNEKVPHNHGKHHKKIKWLTKESATE